MGRPFQRSGSRKYPCALAETGAPEQEKPGVGAKTLYGLWGVGVRRAASSVMLNSFSIHGRTFPFVPTFRRGRTMDPLIGFGADSETSWRICPSGKSGTVPRRKPGSMRGGGAHVDPGFRRGTVTCRKGIIAKQGQGDGKENRAETRIPTAIAPACAGIQCVIFESDRANASSIGRHRLSSAQPW